MAAKLHTRTNQPAGSGSTSSFNTTSYDSAGLVTQRTDFNGNKIQYAYDAARGLETVRVEGISPSNSANYRASGVALPAGAIKTSTEWHPVYAKPRRIAEPAQITTYVYNGDADPFAGNATAICSAAVFDGQPLPLLCRVVRQATMDPNGAAGLNATLDTSALTRHLTYTWNERGQLLTEARSPSFIPTRTIEYYEAVSSDNAVGDVYRITNALGHQTTFNSYNPHGYPLSITDANGVAIQLAYDPRNRLIYQSIGGAVTTHQYDANGLRSVSILPNGVSVEYQYDAAHRLVGIEDSAGNTIEYQLDPEGNLLAENIRNPSGALAYTREQAFDALSRVMQSTDGEGNASTLLYDRNGNRTRVTDPRLNATNQGYDTRNNPVQITDALNGQIQVAYDGQRRIKSVTDQNGNQTSYAYNGLGQLVSLSSPDTGLTTYTYDAHGNRASATDARGITVNYLYDDLNRLINVSYPGSPGENVAYQYDTGTNGIGRLTAITDQSGATNYSYDPRGNLSAKISTLNGQSYTINYTHDAAGLLTGVTYPDGLSLHYQRDSIGRVQGVTAQPPGQISQTLASNLSYRPFGPLKGLSYGNGLTLHIDHDQSYRITSLTVSPVLDFSYSYDPSGNIVTLDHLHQPASGQAFSYDPLDRLDDSTGDYGSLDYSYDPVGNRLSRNHQNGTDILTESYSYAATGNRLITVNSNDNGVTDQRQFSYDDHGNPIAISATTSTLTSIYNHANRLASVSKSGVTTSYTYNALGQRVSKATGGQSAIHYLYNEAGQLLGEYNVNGQPITQYVWLDGQPLAQITAGGVYYYHNDHLGTPRALTDANQQLVWAATYLPFGKASVAVETVTNNLRFPGQYFDSETGLHYNYFRDYDPRTGRYVQSDPIGLRGGINTYAYVLSNPLRNSDFYGLQSTIHYDGPRYFIESSGSADLRAANPSVRCGGACHDNPFVESMPVYSDTMDPRYEFDPRKFVDSHETLDSKIDDAREFLKEKLDQMRDLECD
jgi:RHS repeat-associated protein